MIKHSPVSTAPCYCLEQFYRQICHFLLLRRLSSSCTPSPFSLFYCSSSPLRAVVIKNSLVSTAPYYCLEQFYRQICQFLLLAENLSSSNLSTFSLHYCSLRCPRNAAILRSTFLAYITKETPFRVSLLPNWRRPNFPGSFPPSIISAEELNFCVRDGNRCILFAIVTRYEQ